jgi:aminoglycoside phosphotransferase (APT) family kinase protein
MTLPRGDRHNKVLLDAIVHDFGLPITSSKVLIGGVDNTTIEVNNTYIFRFPNQTDHLLDKELTVLQYLKGTLSCEIPDVLFIGRKQKYIGYRKIQGSTFSAKDAANIPYNCRASLAKQIAAFLVQLHDAFHPDAAKALGIPEYSFPSCAEKTLAIISSAFSQDRKLVTLAERTVAQLNESKSQPIYRRFVHSDLHEGNLILDPNNCSLKGVVDFGGSMIADVHEEFRCLYRFNQTLAREAIDAYQEQSGIILHFQKVVISAQLYHLSKLAQVAYMPQSAQYGRHMRYLQAWAQTS